MDKVLAWHAGSRGFDSHRGHMSERFFRSNRPGYPHPVSSELENSGIRVAVGDSSVTERRRWRPPYQTGKTVHVQAKHYKHDEDGRTARGVCGNGSVPLSHSGNVVTRIEIHTHTHKAVQVCYIPNLYPVTFKTWDTQINCTACQCSPLRRKKIMECNIFNPAQSLLMKHLVIGQRQKAPNFLAFHWLPHGSLVSVGQHFVTRGLYIYRNGPK